MHRYETFKNVPACPQNCDRKEVTLLFKVTFEVINTFRGCWPISAGVVKS